MFPWSALHMRRRREKIVRRFCRRGAGRAGDCVRDARAGLAAGGVAKMSACAVGLGVRVRG